MRITTTATMQKSSRNLAVRAASGGASTTLGDTKRITTKQKTWCNLADSAASIRACTIAVSTTANAGACTTFSGASKFIVRTINQESPCSHGRIVRHDHVQPELRNGSWDGGRRIFTVFTISTTTPDTRPSGRLRQARDRVHKSDWWRAVSTGAAVTRARKTQRRHHAPSPSRKGLRVNTGTRIFRSWTERVLPLSLFQLSSFLFFFLPSPLLFFFFLSSPLLLVEFSLPLMGFSLLFVPTSTRRRTYSPSRSIVSRVRLGLISPYLSQTYLLIISSYPPSSYFYLFYPFFSHFFYLHFSVSSTDRSQHLLLQTYYMWNIPSISVMCSKRVRNFPSKCAFLTPAALSFAAPSSFKSRGYTKFATSRGKAITQKNHREFHPSPAAQTLPNPRSTA